MIYSVRIIQKRLNLFGPSLRKHLILLLAAIPEITSKLSGATSIPTKVLFFIYCKTWSSAISLDSYCLYLNFLLHEKRTNPFVCVNNNMSLNVYEEWHVKHLPQFQFCCFSPPEDLYLHGFWFSSAILNVTVFCLIYTIIQKLYIEIWTSIFFFKYFNDLL